jgi:hypothetical protein
MPLSLLILHHNIQFRENPFSGPSIVSCIHRWSSFNMLYRDVNTRKNDTVLSVSVCVQLPSMAPTGNIQRYCEIQSIHLPLFTVATDV